VAEVVFVVEHAGCPSCAARLREAFEKVGLVAAVDIDEGADTASVRLDTSEQMTGDVVDRVLDQASAGSGHAYVRRSGTWRVLP
jgi:copper chaperone CopZ